jgi:geranylgeranyl diphosphate synthase type II
MILNDYLQSYQERVDGVLNSWLTFTPAIEPLACALRYAVFNGGKRIRPYLVYATGKAFGTQIERLDAAACAVELIHAYSLVHDDLPAMDNSDLRRGQPTCHKAFDEATAILVGDTLHTLAFEVLATDKSLLIDGSVRVEMLATLAKAGGYYGMAGGQALDLSADAQQSMTLEQLETLHLQKTGALIRAAVRLGALASQVTDNFYLAKLDEFARCVGLAFQIQDDILDIESDTHVLGKPQNSDIRNNKTTYPQLLGLTKAKQQAKEFIKRALHCLEELSLEDIAPLCLLAEHVITRKY